MHILLIDPVLRRLAITKLDGTARGGFVVSVVRDLQIPVKFIGVGEKIDDLRDFQPDLFVDALLGTNAKQKEELTRRVNKMLNVEERGLASVATSSSTASREITPAERLRNIFGEGGKKDVTPPPSSDSEAKKSFGKIVSTIGKEDAPKRKKRVKPAQQNKKKK